MNRLLAFVLLFLLSISLMAQSNEPKRRSTYNNGRSTTNYYQRQRQNNSYQSRNTNNQQRSSYNGSGLRAALKRVQEITQEITSGYNARPTARDTRKTANTTETRFSENKEIPVPAKSAVDTLMDNIASVLSTESPSTYTEVKEYVSPQSHMSGTVSLVVNGEGMTKEEATTSALRSAIEQTFGTFVSANTTLLNDDIVRDEIATVSSGNIKSYKELSSIRNDDGIFKVSVSAVVSINELISYAQSHGSSAEFAGQTFVRNIKMRDLNKKNEWNALLNLTSQLESFLEKSIYDYNIFVSNPTRTDSGYYQVAARTVATPNANFEQMIQLLQTTFKALSLSPIEEEEWRRDGMRTCTVSFAGEKYYFRNPVPLIEYVLYNMKDCLDISVKSWEMIVHGNQEIRYFPRFKQTHRIDWTLGWYKNASFSISPSFYTVRDRCFEITHDRNYEDLKFIIYDWSKEDICRSIFYFTESEISSISKFEVTQDSDTYKYNLSLMKNDLDYWINRTDMVNNLETGRHPYGYSYFSTRIGNNPWSEWNFVGGNGSDCYLYKKKYIDEKDQNRSKFVVSYYSNNTKNNIHEEYDVTGFELFMDGSRFGIILSCTNESGGKSRIIFKRASKEDVGNAEGLFEPMCIIENENNGIRYIKQL